MPRTVWLFRRHHTRRKFLGTVSRTDLELWRCACAYGRLHKIILEAPPPTAANEEQQRQKNQKAVFQQLVADDYFAGPTTTVKADRAKGDRVGRLDGHR